jgi:hypothetical protein
MMRSALYPRIADSRMESNHPIRLKILGTVRDPGEFADLKLQWSAMHGKDNMKRAWLLTIYILCGNAMINLKSSTVVALLCV